MLKLLSCPGLYRFTGKKVSHKYKPLIVSGSSGVGKTTIVSHLINEKS